MINLKQVRFGYPGRKKLFNDLDLDLAPGRIYGLLGRNGAGKTTLLRLINGLIFPKEGSIEVMGKDATERHPNMLRDIIFIQEEPFIPHQRILSYLDTYAPFYPGFDRDQFLRLIAQLELDGSAYLDQLSFGQKKKAMICFAIASNARILILDEPTNGLDIPSKSQFRKLITEAMLDDRIVIISTHQVRDMANMLDQILILEDGRIIFNHTLEEIGQALEFQASYSMKPPEDAIYSERVTGGYLSIRENRRGDSSDVDLEALFNAVMTERKRILETLSVKHISNN